MKCTFWNFDHSRSEHEVSLFRTEPHITKSTDGNLFRNPGCLKTVLYSKLQSLLIENIIMLTLVENRRRVVQAVKCVIQRHAVIILPLKLKIRSSICMLSSFFVHSYLDKKKNKTNKQGDQIPRQIATNAGRFSIQLIKTTAHLFNIPVIRHNVHQIIM